MQSALQTAGREAARIADIYFWMSAGGAVIWLAVIAIALFASRTPRQPTHRASIWTIAGGGVIFPVAVLLLLMFIGFSELPHIIRPAADDRMRLEITGHQWWWRVKYVRPSQAPIELANEIRLPVGRRVDALLASRDVVHSFWIPPIAGKLDLIPGRINRLPLEPTRTGTFRGACAEFCGASHARMNFIVEVMEGGAFDRWLERQSQPASAPGDAVAQRGHAAFLEHGCSTCHTVRGAGAFGVEGPDLTHVGSRRTIAAGQLPAEPEHFRQWISTSEILKPGAHMPAFAGLPDETLAALAAYLTQLQ